MNLAVQKLVTPYRYYADAAFTGQSVTISPSNLYGSSLYLFETPWGLCILMCVLFVTSCCHIEQALAPGREKKPGCEARCCRHYLGSMANLSEGRWAPRGRRSVTYKALCPIFSAHLSPQTHLSPGLPVPSCLYMDAIKGFLGPLHLNTSTILDTLVRVFRSSPGKGLSYFSQKLVAIGGTVETARRTSALAWSGFVDCSYPLWK